MARPDLARDWRIGSDATPAGDVRVEEARCRSRLVVLNLCDVTLADERSASRRTLWYAFIGTKDAEASNWLAVMQPVRSTSDPALIATTFGIDKRTARSVTLALAVALLASCIAAALRMTQQGLRNLRAFRGLSGQQLVPVVVDIERHNLMPPRRRLWVYLYDDGGRRARVRRGSACVWGRGVIQCSEHCAPHVAVPRGRHLEGTMPPCLPA